MNRREQIRERRENSILARRYWRSLSEEDKMRIRRLPPKLRKETLVEESQEKFLGLSICAKYDIGSSSSSVEDEVSVTSVLDSADNSVPVSQGLVPHCSSVGLPRSR